MKITLFLLHQLTDFDTIILKNKIRWAIAHFVS